MRYTIYLDAYKSRRVVTLMMFTPYLKEAEVKEVTGEVVAVNVVRV